MQNGGVPTITQAHNFALQRDFSPDLC